MPDRRTLVLRNYRRYQQAERRHKGRILDQFVEETLYTRAYAALVLRCWATTHWSVGPRGALRFVAGTPRRPRVAAPCQYGEKVKATLIRLWHLCDCMCGKRLVPAIRALLPIYERWGELTLTPALRQKLMALSPATADRLLREERRKLHSIGGRSFTRRAPTHLLRQVPIRTFDEWDRNILGQVQADLVGHDGGLNQGDFAFSCTVVDLSVGWVEVRVLANKARVWVKQALEDIRTQMPIPIVALGTDTGSEFINKHLLDWCQSHQINFTRARPYRKNDNCYVEEKNNSLVRHTVGYLRYDTPQERELLKAIYQRQTLLSNYYYPCMKLKSKSRRGSRVYRCYDTPKTPCQRLMERSDVPDELKKRLRQSFDQYNPAVLKRELTDLQNRLWKLARHKPLPQLHTKGPELVFGRQSG